MAIRSKTGRNVIAWASRATSAALSDTTLESLLANANSFVESVTTHFNRAKITANRPSDAHSMWLRDLWVRIVLRKLVRHAFWTQSGRICWEVFVVVLSPCDIIRSLDHVIIAHFSGQRGEAGITDQTYRVTVMLSDLVPTHFLRKGIRILPISRYVQHLTCNSVGTWYFSNRIMGLREVRFNFKGIESILQTLSQY